MSGCIRTSAASWKQWANGIKRLWMCGERRFNYERPHEALGMRCPGEVYLASERKYEGTPEDLDYPQMCSRRVMP